MKYQRKLVRVGNSQGIVLPKTLLRLAGLESELVFEVELGKDKIVLKKTKAKNS